MPEDLLILEKIGEHYNVAETVPALDWPWIHAVCQRKYDYSSGRTFNSTSFRSGVRFNLNE
jgi:hypothetical protein